jgi:hypothetical protein
MKMRLPSQILSLCFPLLFLGNFAFAEAKCPWESYSGLQMAQFDYSAAKNASLTTQQIQDDLKCLEILLQNRYVAQDDHKEIDLIGRLRNLSSKVTDMDSVHLLDLIFNLHQGLPDVHLSYQVNNIVRQYNGPSGEQVELSEQLESEKVYDRGDYVYFRPAQILMPDLSQPQKDLIEIIKNNDRNLVIDLRETRGGGGPLPQELATNIYTAAQHIPSDTTFQVRSYLAYVGLAITSKVVFGDQGKEFYEEMKTRVTNTSFTDMIHFVIEEKRNDYPGVRLTEYKSKIFLLIDQDCGSNCEVIVEKLSAHPNVTTIGANTIGALHYGNPISYVLPNSGILVYMPTRREVLENDAVEGIGYIPNIKTNYVDLNALFEKTKTKPH